MGGKTASGISNARTHPRSQQIPLVITSPAENPLPLFRVLLYLPIPPLSLRGGRRRERRVSILF
jgi:hypothetical protein